MYRIKILQGQNQGAVFPIREGETKVGRIHGNEIVLPSREVSKLHCVILLQGGELLLRDEGSSNGTFVNGKQVREISLKLGDQIKLGDYLLELTGSRKNLPRPEMIALPQGGAGQEMIAGSFPQMNEGFGITESAALQNSAQQPKDLREKFLAWLETRILPKIFSFNQQYEWSTLGMIFLGVFILLNLLLTVFPLVDKNSDLLVRELGRRASSMARQMAKLNTQALISGNESQLDVGVFDQEPAVKSAVIVDLDNRIIAPAARLNQYLNTREEGVVATKASKQYRSGKETGISQRASDSTVVAVEPIVGYRPDLAKNIVLGMAVVSMDIQSAIPDMGELSIVYAQVLIYTGIFGIVLGFFFLRLTLKPLQKLNDEIDEVLKGTRQRVVQEYKWKELNPLWEIINSALQRIPKTDGSAPGAGASANQVMPNADELLPLAKSFSALGALAVALCDAEKRVCYLNPVFEDITGIRNEGAFGQDITQLARDQAFVSLLNDLFEKVANSPDGVQEDFEFSGVSYKVVGSAVTSQVHQLPWGVMIILARLG